MDLASIEVPSTSAARAALEVATEYSSPALLNHSIRAYLWAVAYARTGDIAFDAELLYVAAMLHDIALAAEFDSHTIPFEEAGAHVAWVFGAGAGWSRARRGRVAEVIVRHMWNEVDPATDPEGHLLEVSTGMDISGRATDLIPASLRMDVLARHPRLDLATEFVACFEAQAKRKPDSSAARLVRGGIADRIRTNPLDG